MGRIINRLKEHLEGSWVLSRRTSSRHLGFSKSMCGHDYLSWNHSIEWSMLALLSRQVFRASVSLSDFILLDKRLLYLSALVPSAGFSRHMVVARLPIFLTSSRSFESIGGFSPCGLYCHAIFKQAHLASWATSHHKPITVPSLHPVSSWPVGR